MANVLEVGVYPVGAVLFQFLGPPEILRTYPYETFTLGYFSRSLQLQQLCSISKECKENK